MFAGFTPTWSNNCRGTVAVLVYRLCVPRRLAGWLNGWGGERADERKVGWDDGWVGSQVGNGWGLGGGGLSGWEASRWVK